MSDWTPKCVTHHDACECNEMKHSNDKIRYRNEILKLESQLAAKDALLKKARDALKMLTLGHEEHESRVGRSDKCIVYGCDEAMALLAEIDAAERGKR
jgi:hypothetical protein